MVFDRVIAVRNQKTIYRDGDRCVKVFNAGYSKADVLNEALNQVRMEETELHVPQILEVTSIEGKWAIVSEYIKGKTLLQLMQEEPKDEYLDLLVDLQISVHLQKCPLLRSLKDRFGQKIADADLDATTRYNLLSRLEGMERKTQVCHGDFNPSNIILTRDGTPYILDWPHVTQGNAAADAARTYLMACLNRGKEEAEKYLELFCKKTQKDRQEIQNWIPIVAAAYSVKAHEQERNFLKQWIDAAAF